MTTAGQTLFLVRATVPAIIWLLVMAAGAFVIGDKHYPRWSVAVWVATLLLETLTVAAVWRVAEDGPSPPDAAFGLPRCPWPLRPLVAAWFLAHFAACGCAAAALQVMMPAVWGQFPRLVDAVTFVALGLTVVYAANLYALLAMTVVGLGRRTVNAIWKWRFVVDLAIAIVAATAPLGRH